MGTTDNADLAFHTDDQEQLRIDTEGNVGIGTSSPLQKLHVKADSGDGAIRIEGSSTGVASTARVSFWNSTPTRIGYIGDASSGIDDILLVADADNDFRFFTNPGSVTEPFTIESDGNVGINCSEPDHDLNIGGTGAGCNNGIWSEIDAGETQFITGSSREIKGNLSLADGNGVEVATRTSMDRKFKWHCG